MPRQRSLITGITGQDGTYLADLLLDTGHDVVGMLRDPGAPRPSETAKILTRCELVRGDLLDPASLGEAVERARPTAIYHLAAPTFVPASWEDPTETVQAIVVATAALLAAARTAQARFWLSASSEVFGDAGESPQHEGSPMRPRSPYGVAKLAAVGLVRTMRAQHGMHASVGLLYNHESPRRPEHFLPRKVTRGAAAIALGLRDELVLGDLGATRDWCHAADVARATAMAVAADEPGDYVVASGQGRTVGQLVDAAFAAAGVAVDGHVRVDPAFVRPPEATPPIGDPRRIERVLGWRPEISFEAMVAEMVSADLAELSASGPRDPHGS